MIHISLNEIPRKCFSFDQYMDRIENRFLRDLQAEYPQAETDREGAVWDVWRERCSDRIPAVGIGYERKTKTHACRVEVLRE